MERPQFVAAAQRHQDMVYRLALHYLSAPADAEDAMQEVFLRLLTSSKDFESSEHLRRWLLRVTVNVCKDVLKSPWHKRRVDWEALADQPVFDAPAQGELYRTVMALPEKYRVVLDLFYYEDLTTAEIAQLLGLTQTAVTTRLARARSILKTQLKEDWQDE